MNMINSSMDESPWIVEGVFGELAEHYIKNASCLIWLDIDWSICKDRLKKRGSESKKHMDREQSKEGLIKLIEWASHYYDRTDMRSHIGHTGLFSRFYGEKHIFQNEEDVNKYIKSAAQIVAPDARSSHR